MPYCWTLMSKVYVFDKVSHHHLILKLQHYGIRGTTLNWISSFLSNYSQHVRSMYVGDAHQIPLIYLYN